MGGVVLGASKSGVIRRNGGAKSATVGKTHSTPIKGASPSWAMHTGANYVHTHVIYTEPFQNSLTIQPSRNYKCEMCFMLGIMGSSQGHDT